LAASRVLQTPTRSGVVTTLEAAAHRRGPVSSVSSRPAVPLRSPQLRFGCAKTTRAWALSLLASSDGAARALPPAEDKERVLAQLVVAADVAHAPVQRRKRTGSRGSGNRAPVDVIPKHPARLARASSDRVTPSSDLLGNFGCPLSSPSPSLMRGKRRKASNCQVTGQDLRGRGHLSRERRARGPGGARRAPPLPRRDRPVTQNVTAQPVRDLALRHLDRAACPEANDRDPH
jgi:hypothetical protein